MKTKTLAVLFVMIVLGAFGFWAVSFGQMMNESIKEKSTLDSLNRVKLELEIKQLQKWK